MITEFNDQRLELRVLAVLYFAQSKMTSSAFGHRKGLVGVGDG